MEKTFALVVSNEYHKIVSVKIGDEDSLRTEMWRSFTAETIELERNEIEYKDEISRYSAEVKAGDDYAYYWEIIEVSK